MRILVLRSNVIQYELLQFNSSHEGTCTHIHRKTHMFMPVCIKQRFSFLSLVPFPHLHTLKLRWIRTTSENIALHICYTVSAVKEPQQSPGYNLFARILSSYIVRILNTGTFKQGILQVL